MLNRKDFFLVLVGVLVLQAIDACNMTGKSISQKPSSSISDELRERGGFLWKRPDSVDFPIVWDEFKATKPNKAVAFEYTIQDIPVERYGEAVELMARYYSTEEPMDEAFGDIFFGRTFVYETVITKL